jgi:7-cyano-7-deazaguanine reductase
MTGGMPALETFPNSHPGRDYHITHVCPEFTSVCPKTGQPDFGAIEISYVPNRVCLELKSLKLYLLGFRNEGVYYERVVNLILDDLVAAVRPRQMVVEGRFNTRGGIHSVVRASYEAPARRRRRR